MSARHRETPTNAELAILNVLWENGPSTVREVHEHMPGDTGYTTVLKLMQIMAGKGLVLRDESQRAHIYAPAHPRQEVRGRLVGDLADKAFSGSASRLVMQALSDRPASREELREIRELLDRLEEGDS